MKGKKKGGKKPKEKKKKELNARQKKFCAEYVKNGGNAVAAYNAAGYNRTGKDTNHRGSHLLKKEAIADRIQEIAEPQERQDIADAQEVLAYLTSVMRGESLADSLTSRGLGMGESEPVIVTKHPDERERLEAAKTLAKVKGLYQTNIDVSGVLVQIIDDIPTDKQE